MNYYCYMSDVLLVYCEAVRSVNLATAWLLVLFRSDLETN